jgi:hypothetical protein
MAGLKNRAVLGGMEGTVLARMRDITWQAEGSTEQDKRAVLGRMRG